MKAKTVTKAQLVEQVADLQQQVKELESANAVHKQTDDTLQTSDNKYHQLFETLQEGIWVFNENNLTSYVNPCLAQMLGYTEEEILEKPLFSFMDKANVAVFEYQLDRSRHGFKEKHEFDLKLKNGSSMHTSLGFSPLLDEADNYLGSVAIVTDITEYKQAEETLRKKTEVYELVLASTHDAIWDWDVSNHSVFFSQRWKEMRGFAENEVSNGEEEWASNIHPDDVDRVMAAVQYHFKEKTEFFEEEYRILIKDGSYKWIIDRGIVQRDDAGNVVRMVGAESDITERKKAEEERDGLIHDMGELIKELSCMYKVTESIRIRESLDDLFHDIASFIPPAWHYPEITRSRVSFDEKEYVSKPFDRTQWKQSSDIIIDGITRGSIEVYYLEESPVLDEGPFMKGERSLIDGIARTISEAVEHKQAEESIRIYEDIVRNIPVGLHVYHLENRDDDRTLRMIATNPAAEAFTGVKGEEVTGKILDENFPNLREQGIPQIYADVVRSGKENRFGDVLYEDERVERGWFSVRAFPLPQDRMAVSFENITERKQAEKMHRESEEKYRSLFENMRNGFAYCQIILDENDRPVDFVYLDINDSFERLTGLRREDVLGKPVSEAIPGTKELHPELFDIYGRVAQTGEPIQFEIQFEPLGIWLSISVYSPQIGFFVAVFDNITERKQTENDVKESESKFQDLYDNAPDMFASVDAKTGLIIEANTTLALETGYSKGEIIGKHISKMYHPDCEEERNQVFEQLITDGEARNTELQLMHKDGSKIEVSLNISAFRDEQGNIIFSRSIWRDIAAQKWVRKTIIITVPNGYIPEGALDDNPLQIHKSGYNVEELEKPGFRVYGMGLKLPMWLAKLHEGQGLAGFLITELATYPFSLFTWRYAKASGELVGIYRK